MMRYVGLLRSMVVRGEAFRGKYVDKLYGLKEYGKTVIFVFRSRPAVRTLQLPSSNEQGASHVYRRFRKVVADYLNHGSWIGGSVSHA